MQERSELAMYGDIDPFACKWLRSLERHRKIHAGDVSSKSIVDMNKGDVDGFKRVHLFAGIGGWDLALQLAGWPTERPVWTGSCPCQPFSVAGKKQRSE